MPNLIAKDAMQVQTKQFSGADGAGVLYGLYFEDKLYFLLRERSGRGDFQVGTGGQFDYEQDQSRFNRMQAETEEELYGRLPLHRSMLITHENGQGHLMHQTGSTDDGWSYFSAVAINPNRNLHGAVLGEINYLNQLIAPFGNFLIGSMTFNRGYTLAQAQQDARQLLVTWNEYTSDLQAYIPQDLILLLNQVVSTSAADIDALKQELIAEYKLSASMPFKSFADAPLLESGHALSDYSEAASTRLIAADDLLALMQGEKDEAVMLSFAKDGELVTRLVIKADQIFNDGATRDLLIECQKPFYQAQFSAAPARAASSGLFSARPTDTVATTEQHPTATPTSPQ